MKALENGMTYLELCGFKCDKCTDGWVHVPFGDTTVARKCECMQKRVNLYNIQRSGLAGVIDRMTFNTFKAASEWQKKAAQMAKLYRDNALAGKPDWCMICGQVGSGKTHLATAIMRDLLFTGFDAKYVLWREAALGLKRYQLDDAEFSERLDALIKPNVLYIDDFFKGNITDADKNAAYDIINGRYMQNRPVVITTEKTAAEIMEIDEAIGSRIREMTGGFYMEIGRDKAKNMRMRHA